MTKASNSLGCTLARLVITSMVLTIIMVWLVITAIAIMPIITTVVMMVLSTIKPIVVIMPVTIPAPLAIIAVVLSIS
jgi:hypothetical protein